MVWAGRSCCGFRGGGHFLGKRNYPFDDFLKGFVKKNRSHEISKSSRAFHEPEFPSCFNGSSFGGLELSRHKNTKRRTRVKTPPRQTCPLKHQEITMILKVERGGRLFSLCLDISKKDVCI